MKPTKIVSKQIWRCNSMILSSR